MKAIIKKVGEAPQVVNLENTLEAVQKAVGGYIEVLRIDRNLLMICDEEGKLKGKSYNFDLGHDIIVGDVLFVQSDGEDFTDLNETNIETVLKYFSKTPYQA